MSKVVVHMASPDDMWVRGTVWYAWIHVYSQETGKRETDPWSTGVKVSGKPGVNGKPGNPAWEAAKMRAMIAAGTRTHQLITGVLANKVTIADAYKANFDKKTNKKCSPKTFEILDEKWPHIQNHFGDDRLLKSIEAQDVDKFVGAMKKGDTSPKGIPQTPASCARVLRELFFGMRCAGVEPPTKKGKISDLVGKLNDEGTRSLEPGQFAKLLAHSNPRWKDHLVVYRFTGCRKAELHLIEARHVDFKQGMLFVPGADSANGDSGRSIPIHERVLPILKRRAKQHPQGPLFEPWTNADRDLREAGVRAQVGKVSFNVLKASFGLELLRAEVSTRHVAEFYGHSSTRMVEGHYNKLKAGQHLKGAFEKVKAASTNDTDEE